MLSGGLAEEVATVPATAVSWLLYSVHAADDVILRAPACRGPKNLLSLLGIEIQRKEQILRCAQNDTILSLYRNAENAKPGCRGYLSNTKSISYIS